MSITHLRLFSASGRGVARHPPAHGENPHNRFSANSLEQLDTSAHCAHQTNSAASSRYKRLFQRTSAPERSPFLNWRATNWDGVTLFKTLELPDVHKQTNVYL